MNEICINTPSSAYPIYFSDNFEDIINALKKFFPSDRKICIVTDENVNKYYGQTLLEIVSSAYKEVYKCVFPAGESNKNLNTVQEIYKFFIEKHLDRNSLILALGGGVTGDMAGFAAATYMRGIPFVQIPTTLLSQVDSSVGGKVGVDFLQHKNMIGAFYQPAFVYINLDTLKTLPKEQLSSGVAEVIKHGLILDKSYFEFLESSYDSFFKLDHEVLEKIIRRSCELKGSVVSRDEKEAGLRAILNFGHTLGHAIETLLNFKLFHGQCVSVGMVGAAYLSYINGLISKEDLKRIEKVLASYDLPVRIEELNKEVIYNQMLLDKKTKNNIIHFILLSSIGKAVRVSHVNTDQIFSAIAYIQNDVL
ncbi:MAG: 3-dehydroquinate synthase [Epulopiscium sp.]|jgi:3-dehydroquinate synthase|nr:3-dehydroquinate synthase [Candidatus Epulonipiscium sp.]HOQ17618.1 3-dehydroquinate synthase [Defluviitaleaceae bacterium]HPT76865.1 3-dehydroquinate synthase [Defluviitaleaceae bacterium]